MLNFSGEIIEIWDKMRAWKGFLLLFWLQLSGLGFPGFFYDLRNGVKLPEKLEKDGAISKDDLARAEKELEKHTGDHTTKIDELLKHKEAELLEV